MKITWESLNAYVDGELSPDAAARVAASIGADRAMAARVATLTRLRAVSRRLAVREKVVPTRRHVSWKPIALAASLVAIVALGGLSWTLRSTPGLDVTAAVAANETWLAAGAHPGPVEIIKTAATASAVGALPDLSAAGLRLVYLSSQPFGAGEATFAGYQGSHGCHLGLWTAPVGEGAVPPAPDAAAQLGLSVRHWLAGGARYVLVGRGMDPQRFERMADVVRELVLQGKGATPRQRIALEEAGHTGATCQS